MSPSEWILGIPGGASKAEVQRPTRTAHTVAPDAAPLLPPLVVPGAATLAAPLAAPGAAHVAAPLAGSVLPLAGSVPPLSGPVSPLAGSVSRLAGWMLPLAAGSLSSLAGWMSALAGWMLPGVESAAIPPEQSALPEDERNRFTLTRMLAGQTLRCTTPDAWLCRRAAAMARTTLSACGSGRGNGGVCAVGGVVCTVCTVYSNSEVFTVSAACVLCSVPPSFSAAAQTTPSACWPGSSGGAMHCDGARLVWLRLY